MFASSIWTVAWARAAAHARAVDRQAKHDVVHAPALPQAQASAGMTRARFGALVSAVLAVFGVVWLTMSFAPTWYNNSVQQYWALTSPFAYGSNGWSLSSTYVLKLYEDTAMFYGHILSLLLAMALISSIPPLQRWVDKPAPRPVAWASRGEVLFVLAWLGMAAGWLAFWCNFSNIAHQARKDSHKDWQIAARVLGHMANFFIAWALLPLAKDGWMVTVFGIPWERGIKYHRAAGVLGWAVVGAHMLTWWIKWGMQGLLPDNIITVGYLQTYPGHVHQNNFTTPLVETAWFAFTISVIAGLLVRRRWYKLFYRAHMITAPIFLAAAAIHSWSFWYYALPGLVMWLLDSVSRRVRMALPVFPLAVIPYPEAKLTMVVLPAAAVGPWTAGQYIWLRIDRVCPYEVHPFTLVTPPGCTAAQLLGPEEAGLIGVSADTPVAAVLVQCTDAARSWTRRIASELKYSTQPLLEQGANEGLHLAEEGTHAAQRSTSLELPVNYGGDDSKLSRSLLLPRQHAPLKAAWHAGIEGPHGRPRAFWSYTHVVAVAGGVGITPMIAIVADIARRAALGLDVGHVRRVHLIWVLREPALSHLLGPLLETIRSDAAQASPSLDVQVQLHFTRSMQGSPVHSNGMHISQGRPDLADLLQALEDDYSSLLLMSGPPDHQHVYLGRRIVLTCGPPALIHAATAACSHAGIPCGTEEFQL